METLNITAAARSENVRALCQAVKDGNDQAMRSVAELLLEVIPHEKVLLIPTPGHEGRPKQTVYIASLIGFYAETQKQRCRLVDMLPVVSGKPRESLCDRKRRGEDIRDAGLGLYADRSIDLAAYIRRARNAGFHVYIFDTVVDTGTTARQMAELTGVRDVLCVGLTDNFKQ